MSTRIVEVNHSHKSEWLQLWQEYLTFYEENLSLEITNGTWEKFLNPNELMNAFVLFDGDTMVGFIHYVFHPSTWAKGNYCYLEDLFVTENARNKGYARKLINAVREAAKKNNSERLYWVTGESNKVAQSLYNKIAEKTEYFQYRMGLD